MYFFYIHVYQYIYGYIWTISAWKLIIYLQIKKVEFNSLMALIKEKTKHHFDFLSLVKLRTTTEIPPQWWVYLFHKICKTCQFVSQKLLIQANLLRTWKKEYIFLNPFVEILIQVRRSKGRREMCDPLFLSHSIKSAFCLKSNFHFEIHFSLCIALSTTWKVLLSYISYLH